MLHVAPCPCVVDCAVAIIAKIGVSAHLPQKVERWVEHQGSLGRNLAFWQYSVRHEASLRCCAPIQSGSKDRSGLAIWTPAFATASSPS